MGLVRASIVHGNQVEEPILVGEKVAAHFNSLVIRIHPISWALCHSVLNVANGQQFTHESLTIWIGLRHIRSHNKFIAFLHHIKLATRMRDFKFMSIFISIDALFKYTYLALRLNIK